MSIKSQGKMKKLLIITGIVIAVGTGVYFYMSSRVNYVPGWYKQGDYTQPGDPPPPSAEKTERPAIREENNSPNNLSSPEETPAQQSPQLPRSEVSSKNGNPVQEGLEPEARKTVEKINRELAKNETARISEEELNQIVLLSIKEMMPRKNADFMKAVKSSIYTEKIDLEMIVDVNKIPWDDLPPKARLTKNLLDQLPAKSGSELYMKISGAPVIKDGQLSFDDKTTMQLGRLAYPLKDFLAMPGINQIIPSRISLNQAPFKDVRLENGFIVLVNE
jgi:hypothetical protein